MKSSTGHFKRLANLPETKWSRQPHGAVKSHQSLSIHQNVLTKTDKIHANEAGQLTDMNE